MNLHRMKALAKLCLSPGPLADCGVDSASFTDREKKEFIRLQCVRHVRPLLCYRLKEKGLEDFLSVEDFNELDRQLIENEIKNRKYLADARALGVAFREEKIPFAVLKGVHLAAAVYAGIDLRTFSDIDVLVAQADARRATACALTVGFSSAPDWPRMLEIYAARCQHLPPLQKKGCCLEIHTRLWKPEKNYPVDPRDILSRAIPLQREGEHLRGLPLEDLLLHICLHASYHHLFLPELRPYCDIAEIVHHFGKTLRWDLVVQNAHDWKWRRGVWICLEIARDLVDANIPADVLDRLRCRGETALIDGILQTIFMGSPTGGGALPIWMDIVMRDSDKWTQMVWTLSATLKWLKNQCRTENYVSAPAPAPGQAEPAGHYARIMKILKWFFTRGAYSAKLLPHLPELKKLIRTRERVLRFLSDG